MNRHAAKLLGSIIQCGPYIKSDVALLVEKIENRDIYKYLYALRQIHLQQYSNTLLGLRVYGASVDGVNQ